MMSSKFKGILDVAKERGPAAPEDAPPPPPPSPPEAAPKRRGRPSGKRSDSEFVQVTAYIHKRTHRDVKIALLKSDGDRDFSELVEDLLAAWLKSHE